MCAMILPAERAIRLQADSPEEPPPGPSKYFQERTSCEKYEDVAGTPNPLMRNRLSSGISSRCNEVICLPEVMP